MNQKNCCQKASMKPYSLLLLAIMLATVICACGADPIHTVKTGTMDGYETATIGDVFTAVLDAPEWTKFKSEKNETIVQFDGKISRKLHDDARNIFADMPLEKIVYAIVEIEGQDGFVKIHETVQSRLQPGQNPDETFIKYYLENVFWPVGAPVQFQWALSVNNETFELVYMQGPKWENIPDDKILDVIF